MSMTEIVNTPILSALGWTIIHFLWLGTIIGLLTALLLQWNSNSKAFTRHFISCCGLVLSLIIFICTFALMTQESIRSTVVSSDTTSVSPMLVEPENVFAAQSIIAWCWIVGMVFMSFRFIRHWYWAHHMKTRGVSKPDSHWILLFDSLRVEVGIARTVRFLQSSLIDSPMVIGWFSPIVLVPVSMFTALTTEQIRAILAHELSHIQRYDHFMHLIQSLAEAILFFHPMTWWITKQISNEREHCCDELTIQLTSKPKVLAKALLSLELQRATTSHMNSAAIAANGGSFMNRISRLTNSAKSMPAKNVWRAPISLALLTIISGTSLIICNQDLSANFSALKPDTAPHIDEKIAQNKRAAHHARIQEARTRLAFEITDALLAGKITQGEAADKMLSFERELQHREQRWNGIRERIEKAVESGNMTREEANAKYKELKETNAKRGKDSGKVEARLKELAEKLKTAVENGELTEEEATKKLEGAKRQLHERMDGERLNARVDVYLKKVGAEIHAAIESGEITEEEGKAKWEEAQRTIEARKRGNRGSARAEAYLADVGAHIKAAIANGEMTDEEGREKMQEAVLAIQKRMGEGRRGQDRQKWEELKSHLDAAVESGRMTPEEAKLAMEDFRTRLGGERGIRGGERREVDWEAIEQRIEDAVVSGEMTRDEANAKYEAIRERMATGRGAGRGDGRRNAERKREKLSDECMALRRRLGEAVRSGDMTREEAGKIWEAEGC